MTAQAATALIPHLCCRNAVEAVAFYQKAFGAEKIAAFQMPDGRLAHAELRIDQATFYVVDEWPEQGGLSPLALHNTPVTLYLRVPDCDAAFARAVDAGCTVLKPLENMFWGDRYSFVADPYGHKWEIATPIRAVSTEELEQSLSQTAECAQARTEAESPVGAA